MHHWICPHTSLTPWHHLLCHWTVADLTKHTSSTGPLEWAIILFILLADPDSPEKQKWFESTLFVSQSEVLVKDNWSKIPFSSFMLTNEQLLLKVTSNRSSLIPQYWPDDLWFYALTYAQISWHHGHPWYVWTTSKSHITSIAYNEQKVY